MDTYQIRTMTIKDYEEVYTLWTTIHGFGMRSLDDSKEGVQRFLQRNPSTSVVAVVKEENKEKDRRSDLMWARRKTRMFLSCLRR